MAIASTHADDCELKLISSLMLTDAGDHFLVPVSIAGSSRQLQLELNNAFSGIAANTADQLVLKTKPMPSGVGIRIEGQWAPHLVVVPDLKLDHLTVHSLEIPEIPTVSDADGTLAMDVLAANDFELDLARDKLNIFSRDHCSGKVVYWAPPSGVAEIPFTVQKTGNLLADMTLDGRTVHVAFKTTGRSTMGTNVAHRIFGLDEHSPGMIAIATAPGNIAAYRYSFAEISMEGLRITNPDIVLFGKASDPECDAKEHSDPGKPSQVRWCFGSADVFIGPSVLRRLHLFFAFGEKMLYATAASN